MEDVEFSLDRRHKVTINITDEDKELYDLLKDEYGVKCNAEMWKVMSRRLKELRDKIIPKAS